MGPPPGAPVVDWGRGVIPDLGDAAVVERLLRAFAGEIMALRAKDMPEGEKMKLYHEKANAMADIAVGKNLRYASVRGWNIANGLGIVENMARCFRISGDADGIPKAAVALFVMELIKAETALIEGGDWKPIVDDAIAMHTAVWTGAEVPD